jgi:thiosulfate reductase/polysulfide reductase chain A
MIKYQRREKGDGTKMRTICSFCHTSCGMVVTVKDGKIVKVLGDPAHPASKGYLCEKADATIPLVYHRDRVKTPLIKTKGEFKKVSWEEALDFAADKLLSLRDKYGPKTLVRAIGAPYSYEIRTVIHYWHFDPTYGLTSCSSEW